MSFIHIRNAPLSLALAGLAALTHRRRLRELAPFALGVTAIAAVRTAVNWHFWGTLVTNDHARVASIGPAEAVIREMAIRASGLWFDREFGLLALAPIYLLVVPGFLLLWRRAPRLAGPWCLVAAAYLLAILLPFINVHGWTGTWSPAARFLVPIAPLMAIAVAVAATSVSGVRAVFVRVLVVWQVVLDVLVWNNPKILWNDGDGVSAVAQAIPLVDALYAALPTWHGPSASAWPFVIAAAVCGLVSLWLWHPSPLEIERQARRFAPGYRPDH